MNDMMKNMMIECVGRARMTGMITPVEKLCETVAAFDHFQNEGGR
jgi:hypothetical protein